MDVIRSRLPDCAFWKGKRVLLTGHTGFIGSWAALWLAAMGADVTGFALEPDTKPALFILANVEQDLTSIIGDLKNPGAVASAVAAADPQIVIHLAAQALVRRAINEPAESFATNVQGTVNILNALRDRRGLDAVLIVTSDKVYANDETGRAFVETDELGGKDPYSASKAAAELAARAFAQSYFEPSGVPVATARSGNVIGGGDFASDRLVPDVVRTIHTGKKLLLRHPEATRPWQHVLDCVTGYLLFIEALVCAGSTPRALNFGQDHHQPMTVAVLAESVLATLEQKPSWEHVAEPDSIEMINLALDPSLARSCLGWQCRLADRKGISWTAEWYRAWAAGEDPRSVTLGQIAAYRDLD